MGVKVRNLLRMPMDAILISYQAGDYIRLDVDKQYPVQVRVEADVTCQS